MMRASEALEQLRPVFEFIRFLGELNYSIKLRNGRRNAEALVDAIDYEPGGGRE